MILRYFFDPGSGICLWAADDEARKTYGYPIKLEMLSLSDETIELGNSLLKKFDTSIDWEYPPNSSPWSSEEFELFRIESKKLYLALTNELRENYEIKNEDNT